MKGHPVNVWVSCLHSLYEIPTVVHLSATQGGERAMPLVHFHVAVGEGKRGGAVVVPGWVIDPGIHVRIKETGIVDTIRVLLQKHPGLRRTGKSHLRHLSDL